MNVDKRQNIAADKKLTTKANKAVNANKKRDVVASK